MKKAISTAGSESLEGATMTAEQALFLRDILLPGIEGECRATRRVLSAVPDDRSDYRPDPKSRTARELAWHIVATEFDFFKGIAAGEFTSMEEAPNPTSSMAEMIALYDREVPAGIEQLRALSGEQLIKMVDFFGVFNYPAVTYLTFLSNHSIHHRGQLCAYLRPMGSQVPAIYGPSADERWGESNTATA
jgi:uncharacterized damage-inducible protein DinB